MDIQPTDLRYFFEIAKTLNISRAAERLGVGQPALSQALRRLEETLNVKLFDRYKTGVQLTGPGQILLSEGRQALDQWDHLKIRILAADEKIEGRYTIGCHPSVGAYFLPGFVPELLASYPRLELQLIHGLSREVLESVISFRVDFGIVMNPVRHPDLVIKPLLQDRVSLWRTAKTMEQTLIYDPQLAQVQVLLKNQAIRKAYVRHLHSASLEVIASLTAAGSGVGILPERVAQRYPSLKPVDRSGPFVKDQLCVVYRADRHLTAAGRAILVAIQSSAK